VELIALVLPLALGLGALFLVACVVSIRSGQFDDLDTPPVRALLDDLPARRGSDGDS
jgi:cbb3-type cytochrome oxidase maturation protein